MPQLTMRDALNQALHQEMARDERVIVLGEDVSGGAGGTSGEREASGGIFGVTKGLLPKFGEGRVIDTPISESAIVGAAAGAALAGLRPVAEIMFADFVGVCMDQIYNQIAKFRYMFGGKSTCPVVIRMAMGAGMNMGPQHSQSIYSLLTAVPGLKIVVPSNAYDAKGLLIQAIRDDDPVIFFEHKALYPRKGEVPENAYTIPFGEASLVREGEHVTVVAFARMVPFAERAIDALAKEGITCDLIDPRTTSPLDEDTIIESVEGTGRLVIVDESPPRCGMAADIAAIVAQKAFRSLKRPIIQVTRAAYAHSFRAGARAPVRAGTAADRGGDPPGIEGRIVAASISAITMPKWGIEMTEGTVTGWRVGEGERIERGAEILDVETEKIVNAVEAPAGGVLRRILTQGR